MKQLIVFSLAFVLSIPAFSMALEESSVQSISFHPSLMSSIAKGDKTATIRARHRDYHHVGPAIAKANDGTQITIEIEEVRLTHYIWGDEHINSEILRRENMRDTTELGFHQLYEALKYYYPDFQIGDPVTVVFFRRAE